MSNNPFEKPQADPFERAQPNFPSPQDASLGTMAKQQTPMRDTSFLRPNIDEPQPMSTTNVDLNMTPKLDPPTMGPSQHDWRAIIGPKEGYDPDKISWPLSLGMAGAATGEQFVNFLKRTWNNIQPLGLAGELGPTPELEAKEDNTMTMMAEMLRQKQSLPQNIASGGIGFAPYMVPGLGQAYFGLDLGQQIAERPETLPDMLKGIGQSFKDVTMAPGKAYIPGHGLVDLPDNPEAEASRERLRQYPFENAFNVALPAMLAAGVVKGGMKAGAKTSRLVKKAGAVKDFMQGEKPPVILPEKVINRQEVIASDAITSKQNTNIRSTEIPTTGNIKQTKYKSLTPAQKQKLERYGVVPKDKEGFGAEPPGGWTEADKLQLHPVTKVSPKETKSLSKPDLSKRSSSYIEKSYGKGEITAQEAYDAINKKSKSVTSNPANQADGFYKYTPQARKRLDEFSWVITRILGKEKSVTKQSPRPVAPSAKVKEPWEMTKDDYGKQQ